MWSPDRCVLFLDNSYDTLLPRLAAFSGLSLVAAPWQRCQVSGSSVSIQGAVSYRGGSKLEHPGAITLAPALIAVIDPTVISLKHGERLAFATNALWGHCKEALARWPSWATRMQQTEGVLVQHDPRSPTGLIASAPWATRLVTFANARPSNTIDTLSSRVLAPCGALLAGDSLSLVDGFATNCPDPEAQQRQLSLWLNTIVGRTHGAPPITLTSSPFPELFETSRYIETEYEPTAKPLYVDTSLELTNKEDIREQWLPRLVARRRTNRLSANAGDLREVETGVGRACLVSGLRSGRHPDLVDFTVLGIGVTPYSEGGFVEVGRKIDGKATVRRGWHRLRSADRLENAGCRAGRVVAMYEVPGDGVQMLDGSISPEALIVRGFRSTYRVKNLDPLICSLHSTQHTPLVHTYVADRALELHRRRGGQRLNELELAQALSRQDASQESLRLLVHGAAPSPLDTSAAAVVRQARLDVIATATPRLMPIIYQRLAKDLQVSPQDIDPVSYLRWFSRSCGNQLARWHQLRFLYDYHHPGVSRWTPGHIYTLGENNVSLLAEFPDLDTGTFVDDPDDELLSILQLPAEDLPVLREQYDFFHQREVTAAKTVIETLAALLYHSYGHLDVNPLDQFDESYHDGRSRITATA